MPITVQGKRFFNVTEAAEVAGVSRQTIWRWIKAGKVPSGRWYQDRQRVFTQEEMAEIHAYAHRFTPGDPSKDFVNQLKLFS